MDRSRSPRNLSDEARFLQRLAEPELPPGASDAERAAARAEAAAGVEAAIDELGGLWAEAYQELRPDWQQVPLSPGDRVSFPRNGDGYFQGVVQGQTAPGYYMVTWMDGSSFEVTDAEVALLSPQTPPTRAQAAARMTPPRFTGQGRRLGDE